ncbi:hypothetical protein [Micromonospora sp. CPCC 206061]|uniref:hypothetical protein n=1 Tax=Micromonospora sp. CPCC 206061 TaxID=3122410 RepID=UPI002FF14552
MTRADDHADAQHLHAGRPAQREAARRLQRVHSGRCRRRAEFEEFLPGATDNGVTGDGRRSVVLSVSSLLSDYPRQQRAADTLVENALCGDR